MSKLMKISFIQPKIDLEFLLPDETVRYFAKLVVDQKYATVDMAATAMVYEALNESNRYRVEKHFPVDYPYIPGVCPICEKSGLEDVQDTTKTLGFVKHCPNCYYTFKPCPQCESGLLYNIDRPEGEDLHEIAYCTQCSYEEVQYLKENMEFIEFLRVVEEESQRRSNK